MQRILTVLLAGFLVVVTGCGRFQRIPEGQGRGLPEVPPQFRKQDPAALTRVTLEGDPPAGGAVDQGVVFPTGVTPDEDIVWTDPDNPDAPLPGLEETLSESGNNRGTR